MGIFESLISLVNGNVALLSSLLVPLIAIITVYIAYQQHKTNKNRLRFELYDKRFEIYVHVKSFISEIIQDDQISYKRVSQFVRDTRESEFLFNKEIFDYIDSMAKKAVNLHAIKEKYKPMQVGPGRTRLVEQESELLQWFDNQLEIASKKFGKYLSLKDLY